MAAALAASMLSCMGCAQTPDPAQTMIRFSWWGGDARHRATMNAVSQFMAEHPEIRVECEYGAWNGWEEATAAAVYAETEADVLQVNQNWLADFTSAQSGFLDLNEMTEFLDLAQYDTDALSLCTVDDALCCLPVSMTGRVFFWNADTFAAAGLDIPASFADLQAAGTVFQSQLGDAYYPLALGWYDRMLFLVYLLQSQYGREWTADGKLQYSQEELAAGLAMLDDMEKNHVIPPLSKIADGGADSFDKDENWIEGRYAGIFEWDSSAGKFQDALADGQALTVGDYFTDLGAYHGGFSKIALGFAISKHTQSPDACAMLIQYLLQAESAVKTLGTERGVPLNHAAYQICDEAGLFGDMTAEANRRMQAWNCFQMQSDFENAALKGVNGVYEDVFTGLSYGDYSVSQAAERLYVGIQTVLAGETLCRNNFFSNT